MSRYIIYHSNTSEEYLSQCISIIMDNKKYLSILKLMHTLHYTTVCVDL